MEQSLSYHFGSYEFGANDMRCGGEAKACARADIGKEADGVGEAMGKQEQTSKAFCSNTFNNSNKVFFCLLFLAYPTFLFRIFGIRMQQVGGGEHRRRWWGGARSWIVTCSWCRWWWVGALVDSWLCVHYLTGVWHSRRLAALCLWVKAIGGRQCGSSFRCRELREVTGRLHLPWHRAGVQFLSW